MYTKRTVSVLPKQGNWEARKHISEERGRHGKKYEREKHPLVFSTIN